MLHDVENGVNVNYATAADSPLVYFWDVYAGTVVKYTDPSQGTDITFPNGTDPSSLVRDPDGTLTIMNPPSSPQWKSDPIQIPTGKKLVVKWEYEPLADGQIMIWAAGAPQ